jgi:hypothetical protein
MQTLSPCPTFRAVMLKTTIVHTVTYFFMGLLASSLFSYASLFAQPGLSQYMRPIDDPIIMAGVLFQPIRGLLFGALFYLLRQRIFQPKDGWLVLWSLLAGIGILGTFGPAPGSLEGLIYTQLPLLTHLRGLPEVILQSLLLAWLTIYWANHPEKKWLTWLLGILFGLVLLLPTLGLLVSQPK